MRRVYISKTILGIRALQAVEFHSNICRKAKRSGVDFGMYFGRISWFCWVAPLYYGADRLRDCVFFYGRIFIDRDDY